MTSQLPLKETSLILGQNEGLLVLLVVEHVTVYKDAYYGTIVTVIMLIVTIER